jgi:uncharacterized cupin superfamily protein
MPNIFEESLQKSPGYESTRLGEQAGTEYLGMSHYQIPPGDGIVFHYHLQREEMLIVLSGRVSLRTAAGWSEIPEGEVAAFPRGERGAHGFENRSDQPVRVLVISEQNVPDVIVYPETNEVAIIDAAQPSERRFGALFNVSEAVSEYGGGKAEIVPPAPPSS